MERGEEGKEEGEGEGKEKEKEKGERGGEREGGRERGREGGRGREYILVVTVIHNTILNNCTCRLFLAEHRVS